MINLQHYIFTPKYRRPAFGQAAVAAECEKRLREIAANKGIVLHAVAVMPDHVHVFAELPRTASVAYGAQVLKWYTSNHLRRMFPELKKIHPGSLWGHRYFYRSVGGDRRTVQQYIEKQIGESGGI
jgi:putative transposase